MADGIKAILAIMREKAPRATIVLTGIMPRRDGAGGTTVMPTIDAINQRFAAMADGKTVRYLDVNDKLAEKSGALIDGVTVDGLHLSVAGYQVWADGLKPILTALLGPPAATDHAPPPTGDPAAARLRVGRVMRSVRLSRTSQTDGSKACPSSSHLPISPCHLAQSHASVMQMDSSVRPIGGAGSPAAVSNLRRRSPVSGCAIADCTPTLTRPSA